jgi:hypothetical protein
MRPNDRVYCDSLILELWIAPNVDSSRRVRFVQWWTMALMNETRTVATAIIAGIRA